MITMMCKCPKCSTEFPFNEDNALVKKDSKYLMPCPTCTKLFKVFLENLTVNIE
jgi:transposase-like protein